MAQLPTRESLGQLPSPQGGGVARVSVPSFAGAGAGAAGLGAGLKEAADALAIHARKQDEFETERKFQEFDWDQFQKLDKSMREIQPGQAGEFANTWQQTYTQSAKDFLSTVPEHLKPKYDQKLFVVERERFGAATTFARNEQKRFSVNSVSDAVETIYRPRARVSTTEEIGNVSADFDRLVDANPDLTPIEKDTLKRQGRRAIGQSHLDTLNPDQVRTLSTARTQPGDTSAAGLLRRFEGFKDAASWDVNAHRAGYGSDTVTRADGKVEKVTPNTRVTKEDAERDLARRIPEFQQTIQRQVGVERWNAMPENVKAALTSVAYNYGSLPKSVVAAAMEGNVQTLADSVRALPANRGRRAQEADIILGAGGQPAPLAALNDDDWRRAESAAVTRQARQAVQVAETFERHIIDATSGRGTLPDRASIEADPTLDEARRNALLRQYDAAAKDVVGTQNFIDRLHGGGSFNPYDANEKKYANAAYTRLGADPAALQIITQRTGIVPTAAATQMRADINSNDPNRVADGLSLATNLLANNGNIFAAVEGESDFEKNAVKFRHYVDTLGMNAQQAAQQIIKERDPEYKAKVNARIKSENIDEKIKKELSINDLAGQFNEIPWVPFTDPSVGFDPGTRAVMYAQYAEEVKRHYLETGDWSQAKTLAANDLKRTWGITRVAGKATVVPYPAERAPAYAGIEGTDERIARQAVEAIQQDRGITVDRAAIRLLPIPGRTAQAYKVGLPPPYLLSWQDKDGVVHSLNPGQAFVADPQKMRDEQNLERSTELARRAARQQPILDFKMERRERSRRAQGLLRGVQSTVSETGEARLPEEAPVGGGGGWGMEDEALPEFAPGGGGGGR